MFIPALSGLMVSNIKCSAVQTTAIHNITHISAVTKMANLPTLQFPCIAHHQVKVGVTVNGCTDACVIVRELLFCYLMTTMSIIITV